MATGGARHDPATTGWRASARSDSGRALLEHEQPSSGSWPAFAGFDHGWRSWTR